MKTKHPRRAPGRLAWLRGVGVVGVVVAATWGISSTLIGSRSSHRHPEARPGVTGEHVLHTFNLPRVIPTTVASYEAAARIPAWLDGIRCYCACGSTLGHRSLLSCFEDDHGALCQVCQDEALIAHNVAVRGGTLEQARQAVDARFGPPPS